MSFIVHQVSRTADGRKIVRSQIHGNNEIAIGREASCEIHLADLAVDLRHARLQLHMSGKVEVISISGLGFEVDGRTATQATIEPAAGAELRFGGHLLTVSAEAEDVCPSSEHLALMAA